MGSTCHHHTRTYSFRIILGSRLKSVHSFGMVILEIEKLTVLDAGKYCCKAKNAFGEATSSVTLGCVEKGKLGNAPKFTSQLTVSDERHH